jgi:hypothetical protein
MKETPGWPITIVLAVISAIGAAVITGVFNYFSHQGDIDAKMVELSVGVLRAEVTPETKPLREWAIDVIEKRAGFKFKQEEREALLRKELPFKGPFSINPPPSTTTGPNLPPN